MKKLFILALCLSTPALSATMYKCKGANGAVAYQLKPCSNSTDQEVIEEKPPKQEEADAGGTIYGGLSLGEFTVKPDHMDYNGGQWFVYKVTVTNTTNTEKEVHLKYQAVDYQGFKITRVYLNGTIPPNSYETLTDDSFVKAGEFERINKWNLEK